MKTSQEKTWRLDLGIGAGGCKTGAEQAYAALRQAQGEWSTALHSKKVKIAKRSQF